MNINSGTQNFDGVREVGALFARSSMRSASQTDGSTAPPAARRAIWSPRTPGRPLLLIGHLDTVFERDSPFQKFERMTPTRRAVPASST